MNRRSFLTRAIGLLAAVPFIGSLAKAAIESQTKDALKSGKLMIEVDGDAWIDAPPIENVIVKDGQITIQSGGFGADAPKRFRSIAYHGPIRKIDGGQRYIDGEPVVWSSPGEWNWLSPGDTISLALGQMTL